MAYFSSGFVIFAVELAVPVAPWSSCLISIAWLSCCLEGLSDVPLLHPCISKKIIMRCLSVDFCLEVLSTFVGFIVFKKWILTLVMTYPSMPAVDCILNFLSSWVCVCVLNVALSRSFHASSSVSVLDAVCKAALKEVGSGWFGQ